MVDEGNVAQLLVPDIQHTFISDMEASSMSAKCLCLAAVHYWLCNPST